MTRGAGLPILCLTLAVPGLLEAAPPTSAVGEVLVQPVKHATLLLSHGDTTIYVDPVGGGDAFASFPRPDIILITHTHGDHFDAPTVAAVAQEGTTIITPKAVADQLGEAQRTRTTVLANGEMTEVHGVSVEAIPMYNLTEDRKRFHEKGKGNGYVVTLAGQRVYISGDTEDIPEMRALKNVDAAFICMNLPYTMEPEKAADAVLEFRPRIVYPYHYRGREAVSDLESFKAIVARNPAIEVRLVDWYPD